MKRLIAIALSAFLIASVFVLPARASVSLVNSWKATANNTTTPVAVTTATTSGDLLVAVYYTQATACPTLTAASGWTKSADSGCTGTKHDIAIFTHTATGETSDTPLASLSAAANQNVIIYDVSGANTSTPIDVSSFAAMAASTTPATPNITTTQNGDLLIAAWGTGTGTATASSITAGWAQIDNNNVVFQTVGSEAQTSAGAVTGPSATYASAPSSGVVGTIAIAPAAVSLSNGLSATHAGGPHQSIAVSSSGTAPGMVPLYSYWGNGTGGCAGSDVGTSTAQALFKGLQNCGGTGFTMSTLSTECATGCHPVTYNTLFQTECQGGAGEAAYYTWANANDESAFVHEALPGTSSNRYSLLKSGTTYCASNGTNSFWVYGNPADSASNSWWLTNVYENTSYYPTNNWWGMEDDFSTGPTNGSTDPNGATSFAEYTSVSSWRSAGATHFNAMCPSAGANCYSMLSNALGPGGANWVDNNKTGVDYGIVNWAVDTADVCNNLTKGNFVGFVSEDPFENGSTANYTNIKDWINTLSQIWGNTHCNGYSVVLLGHSSSTQATGDLFRRLDMAASWIAAPNDNSQRIWQWRYNICLCSTEQGVYGEEEIVPQNPVETLHSWSWGGTSDGSGSCNGASGDSGGTVDLAVSGVCGTNTGRLDAGVYVRFFTDCYVLGVDKGPCGAIYNGTNQAQTIASGWFPSALPMSTFKHYVGWTGGQLTSVTIGSNTYSFNCTGTHCDGSAPDLTTYAFPGVPFGGTTSNVIPAGDAALLVGW